MYKTMGIDPSTYTGLAWVSGNESMGKELNVKNARGWPRVQLIAQNIGQTIELWKPDLAIIEHYALGMRKSPDSIITLIEIGTVIRCALAVAGVPWLEVNPSTLKKWTTGKGNADKAAMGVAVKQRWGFVSPSDDVVDAFALAQFGQYLATNGLESLPDGVKHGYGKIQKECVPHAVD